MERRRRTFFESSQCRVWWIVAPSLRGSLAPGGTWGGVTQHQRGGTLSVRPAGGSTRWATIGLDHGTFSAIKTQGVRAGLSLVAGLKGRRAGLQNLSQSAKPEQADRRRRAKGKAPRSQICGKSQLQVDFWWSPLVPVLVRGLLRRPGRAVKGNGERRSGVCLCRSASVTAAGVALHRRLGD